MRGRHITHGPDRWNDRGAGAAEYAGLIVLAALILGALVAVGIPSTVSPTVRDALCKILNLGDGGKCAKKNPNTPPKPNFLPVYCDAKADLHTESLALDLKVVQFGDDFSLLREKLSNGQVWVTVVPANYQVGKSFKVGKNLDIGVNANFQTGSTYSFESDAEADKWTDQIEKAAKAKNPAHWSFWNPWNHDDEVEVPTPAITSKSVGLTANANLDLSLKNNKNLDLGANLSAEVGGEATYEKWHTYDVKTKKYVNQHSYTYKIKGSYSAGVHAGNDRGKGGEVGGSAGQGWSAAVRYMYNDDGTLANIRWITTYSKQGQANWAAKQGNKVYKGKHRKGDAGPGDTGKTNNHKTGGGIEGGREVTRMTQVNFNTPEQRAIGEKYIHDHGVLPPAPVIDAVTGKTNAVTKDPGLNADPLTRLMYEQGKSWDWESNNTKAVRNLIDTPVLNLTISDEQKRSTSAHYLGPPKNGRREYVNFAACTADGVPSKHNPELDG